MARQVEELAEREQRNVSELFREAFRSYRATRLRSLMAEARVLASANAPDIRSEEDVERLVKRTRAEMRIERGKRRPRAAH
jgi:hypothetical protein